MATPVTTAAEFCTLLAKSRLLPPEEVQAQYRQWHQEKPGPDDRVDSFRRFLVARRCLTEYQAALVQRGRADGFFLGGYKILDRVGKGQMGGGVYKAVHGLGQVVALKILPASRAKNPHVLARFQRESRLLTQLDHPNVVRAYQVGESGGVHFIAMEYLEGETLAEVLARRKRLPPAEAARVVAQALDGLQHLHDKRTVHRDLKPANLMLVPAPAAGQPDTTAGATAKVVDVGLGRELFDEEAPDGQTDTQLTQEGSVLGTPDYLAPEQARDARAADIRADIYSLGCVLFECVAGRPPFPEPNIMAQMLKHATERPAPLATFVPDLPAGFQSAVDRFLAKAPADRYQTPAEAAAALRPFARGSAAAAPKVAPAFRDWLTAEGSRPADADAPARPAFGSGPAPALPKGGSGPAPALGAAKPAPPKPPAPKPGTAPAPALKSGSAPRPAPAPPRPAPAALPVPAVEEVEVELVVLPPAAAPARPLWQPDRRDWIMLAAGAAGVLSAVGAGFTLARVARALTRKPDAGE